MIGKKDIEGIQKLADYNYKYDPNFTTLKLAEECSELSAVLAKSICMKKDCSERIWEESIDVVNMLIQLHGCDNINRIVVEAEILAEKKLSEQKK